MPKKPTSLHLLNGNPSRIKNLGEKEPKPPLGAKPPLWLDEVARNEWDRIAPRMERVGLLTELDEIILSNLCQEYSDMLKYQKVVSEEGATYEYTNTKGSENTVPRPETLMLHKSRMMIKAYCVELGLTPSARSRIQLPGEATEDDVITKLMNKRKGNV